MGRFSKNSLGRLAKRRAQIDAALGDEGLIAAPAQKISPRASAGPVAMSFAQQRLWVIDRLAPGAPTYNVPLALHMRGALDRLALRQSLQAIVRRHGSLRTTFTEIDGEPRQVVGPVTPTPLPIVDLRGLPASERAAVLRRYLTEEGRYSFDLTRGPLFRAVLLCLGSDEHVLLLNAHHIITDGLSSDIMLGELAALYDAAIRGEPAPLPELPIQYTDFSLWQREWMQGEILDAQLGYWKHQLAGAPALELPTDHIRPPAMSFRGAHMERSLPKALGDALNAIGQEENCTSFMTQLAAYATLLSRYSGQDDIAIGIAIGGRGLDDVANLIGFFVNSLVLRIDLAGNPSFRELLRRVYRTTLAAYAHQDVPFEKVVEVLLPQRDQSRMPLFQTSFGAQSAAPVALSGLTIDPIAVENYTSKFDISLLFEERPDELLVQIEYCTDLFEAETIARMLEHFQVLLESIVADPLARIAQLPLLGEAERHRVLFEMSEAPCPFDDRPIPELIEGHAQRTPDATALMLDDTRITYRELDRRANQLAQFLRARSVALEVFVGVHLERSVEMVIGLLGILKAGGVYVPLALSDPPERRAYNAADTRMPIVLTLAKLAGEWAGHPLQVVCLDRDWSEIARCPAEKPEVRIYPDNLAYAIYTSGSTGAPKGVLIAHRGMCNFIGKLQTCAQPGDRTLLWSALSFDLSLLQTFMALTTGSALCIARPEELLPGPDLLNLLHRQQITHLNMSPSALAALPDDDLPHLRLIICGGEACSADLVARWAPGRIFYNGYGPTEVTVGNTLFRCVDARRKPPIGRSMPNTQMYVLDAWLQPVPVGVLGELYIGGVGVGRGYLNQPGLTAERFVPDPFLKDEGGGMKDEGGAFSRHPSSFRLYKTGDLARWLPDGTVDYLGRKDHQIKLRGYRIELREIEVVLDQHPAVCNCVVLLREDTPGDKRLVAYVVPTTDDRRPTTEEGHDWSAVGGQWSVVEELRAFLATRLPDYMVPSAFVLMEALPLTPNGKVDRRALPAPASARQDSIESVGAPRDSIELRLAQIWEALLNVRPIGLADNFFALGGHSLLAMRLIAQIEHQFGKKVPLSSLFQAATVEHMAAILRQQDAHISASPLIAVQGNGTKLPLFCAHPVGGNVMCYLDLAAALGPDQPFYALQSPEIEGQAANYARLEEMAAQYVAAIQAVQPEGPYHLGGWSMGGVIAYEMAQQMLQQGHDVGLLALIDSYTALDELDSQIVEDEALTSMFAWDMQGLYGLSIEDALMEALAPNQQLAYVVEQAKQARAIPPDTELAQIDRLMQVFKANTLLLYGYQPRPYPGLITLIRAGEELGKTGVDPLGGWRELAEGGIELLVMSGNHYSALRPPLVRSLAGLLGNCLKGWRGRSLGAAGPQENRFHSGAA